jgi:hypothetical protein
MKFGTIIYDVRDKLDISNGEYLLLDCVSKLQSAPNSNGRCRAAASYLAYVAGVTTRRVFPMMDRLKEKGLLIVHPDNSKEVASIFYDMAIAGNLAAFEEILGKKEGVDTHDATSYPMTPRHTPHDVASYPPMTPRHPPHDVASHSSTNIVQVGKTLIRREYTHATEKNQFFKKQENVEGEKAPSIVCLFRECNYFKGGAAGRAAFEADLKAAGCPDSTDFEYYFNRILSWSDDKAAKSANWGVKAAQFVIGDRQNGKMITKAATHEAAAPKYKIKETRF